MNSMFERLKQIEARANAATPGPWKADRYGVGMQQGNVFYIGDTSAPDNDVAFTSSARRDVPDMAAALRAVLERHACIEPSLEQEREQGMRDWCGECDTYWPCPTVQEIEEVLGR